MKNFNLVRVDSKGRIILPYHIRDYIGLKKGTELLIVNNEKKELKIFPLIDKKTARITILMDSSANSFAKTISILEKNKAEILMSIGKAVDDNTEWNAIIDISESKIKKLEKELKSLKTIRKVSIAKN